MKKLIFFALTVFALNLDAFSQIQTYSTPTIWENYYIKDENASFLMPKLPLILDGGDICKSEKTKKYAAYSQGIVYVFVVTSKTEPTQNCENKRKFDATNFSERVKILEAELKQAKVEENGNEVKFTGEDKIFKLVNDYKNKRWFELQAFEADESKTEVKDFLNSLKIEKDAIGKEVGNGAPANLGDEQSSDNELSAALPKTTEQIDKTTGLKIILKPKPNYTDFARKKNVQGVVRLKVTFLANGGIGNITLLEGLPYGLSEQAIAAARKIFFIPARRENQPMSVTKIVEYGFTLY